MELTIARAAEAADVGIETVRFYERRGLIAQPPRVNGSYRKYGADHVRRIRFVRRAQDLGFTLEEIESLLKLQDGTRPAEVRRIASARLDQIRSRLRDLRRMEKALTHLLHECEEGHAPRCPIIEAISNGTPTHPRP